MDNVRPDVHCPFGCVLEDCDENGYCRHLVGFTNNGRDIETIQVNAKTGTKYVTCKKELIAHVIRGDRLINPEREIIDKGVRTIAKRWVSARVYRRTGAEPVPEPETETAQAG